jgi:hypothetical protein
MPAPTFKEFPLSFRIAQRGMLVSLIALFFGRRFIGAKAGGLGAIFMLCILICLVTSILATGYVVLRYPFLGLVDAVDGDLYHRNITARRSTGVLLRMLNCLLIIVLVLACWMLISRGRMTVGQVWFCGYSLVLIPFLLFLGIRYDRIKHPTIATFIRASLGLGIPLYPLFLPVIYLGSRRCRALLEKADLRLEE